MAAARGLRAFGENRLVAGHGFGGAETCGIFDRRRIMAPLGKDNDVERWVAGVEFGDDPVEIPLEIGRCGSDIG